MRKQAQKHTVPQIDPVDTVDPVVPAPTDQQPMESQNVPQNEQIDQTVIDQPQNGPVVVQTKNDPIIPEVASGSHTKSVEKEDQSHRKLGQDLESICPSSDTIDLNEFCNMAKDANIKSIPRQAATIIIDYLKQSDIASQKTGAKKCLSKQFDKILSTQTYVVPLSSTDDNSKTEIDPNESPTSDPNSVSINLSVPLSPKVIISDPSNPEGELASPMSKFSISPSSSKSYEKKLPPEL